MDRSSLRARSKCLCGSQYRLEISAAIHRSGGEFHAQSIADALQDVRYGAVQQEMKHLEKAGLLVAVPDPPHVRYVAVDDPWWASCNALESAWLSTT